MRTEGYRRCSAFHASVSRFTQIQSCRVSLVPSLLAGSCLCDLRASWECSVAFAKGYALTLLVAASQEIIGPKVVLLQVSEVSHPGHFKSTSNERVSLMYKEASDFARRLDKCSRQIKAVEAATAGTLW